MADLIMTTCAKEENQQEWAIIICMACPLQWRNLVERSILEIQEKKQTNRKKKKQQTKKEKDKIIQKTDL